MRADDAVQGRLRLKTAESRREFVKLRGEADARLADLNVSKVKRNIEHLAETRLADVTARARRHVSARSTSHRAVGTRLEVDIVANRRSVL